MPPIRPWQPALEAFSVTHEAELLATANAALAARGAAPLGHLAAALNGDTTFLFSLPLVDPYARYRQAPTLSPFNMPPGIHPLPWPRRRPTGLSLYLPEPEEP